MAAQGQRSFACRACGKGRWRTASLFLLQPFFQNYKPADTGERALRNLGKSTLVPSLPNAPSLTFLGLAGRSARRSQIGLVAIRLGCSACRTCEFISLASGHCPGGSSPVVTFPFARSARHRTSEDSTMFTKPSYILAKTCPTDLWQISSPSGHILFESACRREVEAVCARLNRRFRRRRLGPVRPARPRVSPGANPCTAVAIFSQAIAPAFG